MPDTIYVGFWGNSYGATADGKVSVYTAKDNCNVEAIQTIDTGSAISAIYQNPHDHRVYAVGEVNEGLACGMGGDIFVFETNSNGTLEQQAICSSMGAFPLDIAFLPGMVAVVNHGSTSFKVLQTCTTADGGREMHFAYDESSLVLFSTDEEYKLNFLDIYIFTGSGKIPFFQNSASPHSICQSADGSLLAVPLRGTDQVMIFKVSTASRKLMQVLTITVTQGSGPRNAAFHPTLPVIYVMNEIEASVDVFSYSIEAKSSQHLGTVSTLCSGKTYAEGSQSFGAPHPVAIVVAPSGQFVYVLTRSTNTITTYQVLPMGMLRQVDVCDTLGGHPRTMVFGDNGRCLYLSNLDTQTIVKCQLDFNSGIPCDATIVANELGKISCLGK